MTHITAQETVQCGGDEGATGTGTVYDGDEVDLTVVETVRTGVVDAVLTIRGDDVFRIESLTELA